MENIINYKIFIGSLSLFEVFSWIYVSYHVHENMRSHTGGSMLIFYGIIHVKASKHKIRFKKLIE